MSLSERKDRASGPMIYKVAASRKKNIHPRDLFKGSLSLFTQRNGLVCTQWSAYFLSRTGKESRHESVSGFILSHSTKKMLVIL